MQSRFEENKEEFKSIISTFKSFGSKTVLTLSWTWSNCLIDVSSLLDSV